MRIKTNIFIGVVLFYIAYTILPVFSSILRLPVWMPSIFVSLILCIIYPQIILRNKTFFWFLLYCIITFLFMYFGRIIKLDIGTSNQLYQLLIEYSFFLPNIAIAIVFINLKDSRIFKVVFIGFVVLLVLSFVFILPQLQQYDLRQMAVAIEEGASYETNNILGYTLLHAYVIILPAIYYCFNINKGFFKALYFIILLLVLFVISKSSITTTLLISLVVIVFSFAYGFDNKIVYYFILVFIGFAFLFLYYGGGLVRVLDWVSPYFEGTAVEMKIVDMKQSLISGQLTGGTIVGRQNLHRISWTSFISNPIIGGGRFGGHSGLVDRLACLGLVGFIPYIMIYWSLTKKWLQFIIVKKSRFYYYLGIGVVVVLLYSKGLFGNEGNLFFMVLLPITIVAMQLKEKREKNLRKKVVLKNEIQHHSSNL